MFVFTQISQRKDLIIYIVKSGDLNAPDMYENAVKHNEESHGKKDAYHHISLHSSKGRPHLIWSIKHPPKQTSTALNAFGLLTQFPNASDLFKHGQSSD